MPALGYFYYKRSGGGRQSGKNVKESARFLSHPPRIPLFGKELEKSGKLCYNRSIMRNGRRSLSAVQNYEIFVKFHREAGIMAEKSGVQSVERIFQLIEHLAAHPTGVSLQRLAEETGLAKSTVHRLLASLVGLGYVVQDEENGHYRLTLKMFELSSGIVDSMDIMGVAKAHLERLSQRTGEAVHLVIRDGRDIVYIYKTESGPMRMSSRVGLRSPLYCTGVGKAILATLPGDELEDIWTHSNVQKLTDKTITDLEELRSQLVEVRANGYAIDDEENELGVRCVAVAIPGADGRAESAFSISGLAPYMTPERIRRIATLALDARTDILADLGLR
jgi:DNA-binding IclR family transcriptional regulator